MVLYTAFVLFFFYDWTVCTIYCFLFVCFLFDGVYYCCFMDFMACFAATTA